MQRDSRGWNNGKRRRAESATIGNSASNEIDLKRSSRSSLDYLATLDTGGQADQCHPISPVAPGVSDQEIFGGEAVFSLKGLKHDKPSPTGWETPPQELASPGFRDFIAPTPVTQPLAPSRSHWRTSRQRHHFGLFRPWHPSPRPQPGHSAPTARLLPAPDGHARSHAPSGSRYFSCSAS